MREELRRCNFIGDKAGIYFLGQTILSYKKTDIESVRSQCTFNNNIRLDLFAALAFFEELKLIERISETIIPTSEGEDLSKNLDEFSYQLSAICLRYLVDKLSIMAGLVKYDERNKTICIAISAFPFYSASLRNFLIEYEVIYQIPDGMFCVTKKYEKFLISILSEKRKRLTVEQLISQLDNQREQGRSAEEFVLKFEFGRLDGHNNLDFVERISEIDVSAGYDIVSFDDLASQEIDRYIEVKSYIGHPHFYWSQNERAVAKLKGDSYYLYLVDFLQIEDQNYIPEIIKNPYEIIKNDDNWIMEATSYKLQKIN